jgi:hypothetical protein
MSFFKRLLGKRDAPEAQAEEPEEVAGGAGVAAASGDQGAPGEAEGGEAAPVELPLPALVARFKAAIPPLEHRSVDLALVRARLADRFRDVGLTPLYPEIFDALASGLDDEARRRLALLVDALFDPGIAPHLPALFGARHPAHTVQDGFLQLAFKSELLTMELLRKSGLRVEELARAFIAALGASVEGEAPEVSLDRLARLDYARLLSEAEQAKLGAEARVQYLKRLQDEHLARMPRRGKW